jgi:hypothetical protein
MTTDNGTRHKRKMSLCRLSHFIYCYAECHYAECPYAEYHYAECSGTRYLNRNYSFENHATSHGCHILFSASLKLALSQKLDKSIFNLKTRYNFFI